MAYGTRIVLFDGSGRGIDDPKDTDATTIECSQPKAKRRGVPQWLFAHTHAQHAFLPPLW